MRCVQDRGQWDFIDVLLRNIERNRVVYICSFNKQFGNNNNIDFWERETKNTHYLIL